MIRQFLKKMWAILHTPIKKMWAILRTGITIGREWVVRVLKKSWRYCAKFIPKPKDASEKSKLDNFLEKFAYHISFGIGTVGGVVLIVSLFSDNMKLTQNIYYFLIFVGAGLATILATWRGRQSERQISKFDQQIEDARSEKRVARFEKAVDMATDTTSPNRRASGFLILDEMLTAWIENFDDSKENDIVVLSYLTSNYFRMKGNDLDTFKKLYAGSRRRWSKQELKHTKTLFAATHKPVIDKVVLRMCDGIVKWCWRTYGASNVISREPSEFNISTSKVAPGKSGHFIFSEMDLRGINFLVVVPGRGMVFPTLDAYANFTDSFFLQVEMHESSVDHVDFSKSNLFRINNVQKGQLDYSMSCIGTIFDRANLLFCNFEGADFKDASFVETNISASDFSRAKNLTPKQFQKGAYWIRPGKPQFPESWTDNFIELLARDAQDEEEKGQGGSEG